MWEGNRRRSEIMLGTHNKVRKREITAIQRVGPDCDTLGDL